jgi:hypothetical protein
VRLLADHCDLYNAALTERREAWRMRRVGISYGTQSAQLKEIRQADPVGQGRHSFTAQQQTLRRLNAVFAAFYQRCKTGEKKPGYPRFKPYSRFHQVRFVAGDGAKWTSAGAGRGGPAGPGLRGSVGPAARRRRRAYLAADRPGRQLPGVGLPADDRALAAGVPAG